MVLGQEKHSRLRSLFFSDLLLLQLLVDFRLHVNKRVAAVLAAVRAHGMRQTRLFAVVAYRKTRRHQFKV